MKKTDIALCRALAGYMFICYPAMVAGQAEAISQAGWGQEKKILERIIEPEFPEITLNILDFGARGDGKYTCTDAINTAVRKCSEGGGGIVLIPEGSYLTGPVILLSNVNLHLREGAVLLFSTDPADYLPLVLTRWEGIDCYNYSPLIYAYNQENIAITGKGVLNGQAGDKNWWKWKDQSRRVGNQDTAGSMLSGRDLLLQYEQEQVSPGDRKFGEGHFLRPPFVQFIKCRNILVEDITIENSPFWLLHPLLSENITIRGVKANSLGPNSDGCDPESCSNVLIDSCFFNTGDDCIAIKSGRNYDGRRWNIPSQNIIIRNCEMREGHGGVVIGSEISGGCRNIYVENCYMDSPDLDRAIRIKTNGLRGGVIEDVFVRDIEVGQVKEAVLKIDCTYETKTEEGDFPPLIQRIYLENVHSRKSKYPVYLTGFTNRVCIRGIVISNSEFEGVEKESKIHGVSDFVMKGVYINGIAATSNE